jgi:hypothetical protein
MFMKIEPLYKYYDPKHSGEQWAFYAFREGLRVDQIMTIIIMMF